MTESQQLAVGVRETYLNALADAIGIMHRVVLDESADRMVPQTQTGSRQIEAARFLIEHAPAMLAVMPDRS
jgi:predicted translin family RNA/ssDNA-binding protein